MRPRTRKMALTMGDVERFWRTVEKGGDGECWLWKGVVSRAKGFEYGAFYHEDLQWKAHRVAYELTVGPIPEGMTLDHVENRGCRSKLCCNPAHLEPVTQSENTMRQYRSPSRLYRLTCRHGHAREFGVVACRKCAVIAVARSQAKKPEKYREMGRVQKQRERARKRLQPEVREK